jgi:hypothetical protein
MPRVMRIGGADRAPELDRTRAENAGGDAVARRGATLGEDAEGNDRLDVAGGRGFAMCGPSYGTCMTEGALIAPSHAATAREMDLMSLDVRPRI